MLKFNKMQKFKISVKTSISICLILVVILLSSCSDNSTSNVKIVNEANEANKRIHLKAFERCDIEWYQIIEVDGVEYIAPTNGGICPLVKDGH